MKAKQDFPSRISQLIELLCADNKKVTQNDQRECALRKKENRNSTIDTTENSRKKECRMKKRKTNITKIEKKERKITSRKVIT